jgi:hypothetical protein
MLISRKQYQQGVEILVSMTKMNRQDRQGRQMFEVLNEEEIWISSLQSFSVRF